MSYPVYYVEEDDTLPHLFDTFDGGTGASITLTGLATSDIEIYKDGSVTQRSSDSGYTLLDTDGIDFDSITGIHGFSIDLSDNTDAGFYAVGSWYHVVISSVTIDSQTVNFVACGFRIVSATRGMAGTALPDAAADAAGGLPISDAGGLDLDTQIGTDIDAILTDTADMQPKLGTVSDLGSGATIADNLADIEAETDDIGAAGAGLTAIPWNASWDAEVQSEVTDGLNAYDPPTYDEMEGFFQISLRSDAAIATDRSALLTAINADEGSGAGDYDNTSEALEAIRDRGDTAWTTGGGGSITDILNVQPLVPNAIDLANTATYRLGLMLFNALDDLPSTGEITPGTISIDRKAIGGTSWSSVVSDAAMSELAGLVYYDEVFDSGTGYAAGDSIRVTFKSQLITVAANDYEISDSNGRIFYTYIREAERGTDSALLAASAPTNFGDLSITASTGRVDVAAIEGTDATDAINTEVDTAIETYGLDHLLAAAVVGGDVTDNSIIAYLASKSATADWDSFDNTTDSLEAISDEATPDAATIADAVWDEPLSGHVVAGSAGAALDSSTIADAIWDEVMESGAPAIAKTARQWMRLMAAALFGEDAGTGDWSAKSVDGSTTRIAATLTTAGKRSSVSTLDGS